MGTWASGRLDKHVFAETGDWGASAVVPRRRSPQDSLRVPPRRVPHEFGEHAKELLFPRLLDVLHVPKPRMPDRKTIREVIEP